MFAHVVCCLRVVLCYGALELYHPHCSAGHRPTALFGAVAADVPVCAHLASPSGGRALIALCSLVPLFDPVLLSLLPAERRDKSSITLRRAGTDGEGRAGELRQGVETVSNPG